jgi:hypothetical protein
MRQSLFETAATPLAPASDVQRATRAALVISALALVTAVVAMTLALAF